MNFPSIYCRHLTGAFRFKRQQDRSTFWACVGADFLFTVLVIGFAPLKFLLVAKIWFFLMLLVIAGNAIQRLNDAGLSRWLLLLWFIPFVGVAILAILLLLPGRKPADMQLAPPSSITLQK
ncbi:TPA: DUF805 domain-containing protein [Pseudomonas aeruginosa]